MIAVSVEHFTNFNLGNLPAFAIATGDSYLGPVTAGDGALPQVEQHQYPGCTRSWAAPVRVRPGIGVRPGPGRGRPGVRRELLRPAQTSRPRRVPLVPVIVNGVNPPWPTPKRCYDFGRMIRDAVEAPELRPHGSWWSAPAASPHWVGLPEAGSINDDFDRDFIARLESGDPQRSPTTRRSRSTPPATAPTRSAPGSPLRAHRSACSTSWPTSRCPSGSPAPSVAAARLILKL